MRLPFVLPWCSRYVPPDQARVVSSIQASVSGSSASSTGSTPEVQPLKLNKTPPRQSPGRLGRTKVHNVGAPQEKKFDLLSDLGGDIFATPPSHAAGSANFANFAHFPTQSAAPQGNSNANFANFEAFGNSGIPSHLSTSPPSTSSFSSGGGVPIPSMSSAVPSQRQMGSSSGDRYAALAELDNELSSSAPTGSNVQGMRIDLLYESGEECVCTWEWSGKLACTDSARVTQHATWLWSCSVHQPVRSYCRCPRHGQQSFPKQRPSATCSFSGSFGQPFPGHAPGPYPQLGAYHPQPNGPVYPIYAQNKPPNMVPFGLPVAGPGLSNNPFM
ncbi:hypothetical protein CRUP_003791, partial [Coryphaenoides rupestris]